MTLRGQIFSRAFAAIGIPNYVFDTTAEEQASAAGELDGMLAQWEEEGVSLGYVGTGGDPKPDIMIDTPAWADNAIVYNLALALAPSFGKEPSARVRGEAKRGYSLAVSKTLKTPVTSRSSVPISGGGNWWRRFRGYP